MHPLSDHHRIDDYVLFITCCLVPVAIWTCCAIQVSPYQKYLDDGVVLTVS